MRYLWLLLLLLIGAPAQAQSPDVRVLDDIEASLIAEQLLPLGHVNMIRGEIIPLPGSEPLNYVRLYTREGSVDGDFCGRDILSMRTTPIPSDMSAFRIARPRRVGAIEIVQTYRHLGPGRQCSQNDLPFFHIYGTGAPTAFADVRRLAALIERARVNPDAPLPLPAGCRDEFDSIRPCSAAAMIAALSTGDIQLVATRRGDDLRFGLPLEDRARRGEGRLAEISLRQDVMHYTVRMLVRGNRIIALHISGGIPIP